MRPETHGQFTISTRQLMLILASARLITAVDSLPVLTSGDAGRDAWIAALAGGAIACLLALFLGRWIQPWGRGSFTEYAKQSLGSIGGGLVSLVAAAAILTIAYFKHRVFGSLLQVASLPDTPMWAINLPALAVGGYLAWRGLDGIGRAAEVIGTLVFLSALVSFSVGTASLREVEWLLPVLDKGVRPLLLPSIQSTAWHVAAIVVVLGAFPHLDRRQGAGRAMFFATAFSTITAALLTVATIIEFGPKQAGGMSSPLYSLLKNVSVGESIRRLEVLIMMVWVPAFMLITAIYLWVPARLLSGVFGFQTRHIVLGIIVLMAWPVSANSPAYLENLSVLRSTVPGWVAAGILALVLLAGVAGRLRAQRAADRKPGAKGSAKGSAKGGAGH